MTARYIILANPAMCHVCGKLLRKDRGAFWDAGIVVCVRCMRKTKGEAEKDPEEEMLYAEEIDRQEGKGRK